MTPDTTVKYSKRSASACCQQQSTSSVHYLNSSLIEVLLYLMLMCNCCYVNFSQVVIDKAKLDKVGESSYCLVLSVCPAEDRSLDILNQKKALKLIDISFSFVSSSPFEVLPSNTYHITLPWQYSAYSSMHWPCSLFELRILKPQTKFSNHIIKIHPDINSRSTAQIIEKGIDRKSVV